MSDSFHHVRYRFFINDIARSEIHRHPEPLFDHILQNLKLYLPHKLYMNLLQFFFPYNMKLGFFLFQLS